ncbi:MAG: helix-turn-helix domain-containing protein [Burkholderiaceae bacterium]|nr:helix-turn-helix domain-containing protein [Burkholderiaceae bacterium]
MLKTNRSLSRGLRILRAFNDLPQPTLTELAKRVDLTKATCLRFLQTLQDEGYLDCDESLKRYQLRPLVLELGYAALTSMSLPVVAGPEMQALADRTGGAVNLAVLDGHEVVIVGRHVAHAEKSRLVTMNLHVGMRLPAHCTAMGRVLIGATHPDVRAFVATMPLEKLTPKTLVNRPRLVKAIIDAAERGYEVVEDQLSLGYGAVGIPLVTPRGQKFALTVSFTTSAYTYPKIVKELLPALNEAAGQLARLLAAK